MSKHVWAYWSLSYRAGRSKYHLIPEDWGPGLGNEHTTACGIDLTQIASRFPPVAVQPPAAHKCCQRCIAQYPELEVEGKYDSSS